MSGNPTTRLIADANGCRLMVWSMAPRYPPTAARPSGGQEARQFVEQLSGEEAHARDAFRQTSARGAVGPDAPKRGRQRIGAARRESRDHSRERVPGARGRQADASAIVPIDVV